MVWTYIIWFAVALIVGYALSAKPKQPRAASIDDFEVPQAEEGRPIPVVFGDVLITGGNVVWHGAMDVKPIKKRSGFSKQTVGFKYHIGFHMELCHGPVDAVTAIEAGEKGAWNGNVTANATFDIVRDQLFGGDSREGGLNGTVHVMMGAPDQTPNAYLVAQQGSSIGYRGVLSIVARGGSGTPAMYIGTSPYLKPWAVRVRRILEGWDGGSAWFPELAEIGTNMNPAHIIYQTLTDSRWGLGLDPSEIDDANFRAAATQLFAEGLGLSMIWNQASTIEQFIEVVCEHIAGGLIMNYNTGQLQLLLVRGDYDPNELDTYGPSDIMGLKDFQRSGWGDTVNEITLVYTDPDTRKQTSISTHDLANIDIQGRRVPQTIERKGITDHAAARIVLSREAAGRVTPLSKVVFDINRRAWAVQFGGLFKLDWPDHDINGVVYRVTTISKGTQDKNAISIEAVEDIYALGVTSTISDPPTPVQPDPVDTPPEPVDTGVNVISVNTTSPPGTPNDGDSYFIPGDATATGDWVNHEGQLADWDESSGSWIFTDVPDNSLVHDDETGQWYTIEGGVPVAPPWPPLIIQLACSDLTTDLAAGTNKAYFRAPCAFSILDLRASLLTASSSGALTIDVNVSGTTIMSSTKLTVDQGEKTSETAATPPVLTTTIVADDAEVTIDLDSAGTGARGLILAIVAKPL